MAKYKIIPSSRTIVQSPISIGHKAEKGVEAIEFDVTAWVETYGSGTLTVIMRRWGDAIPYPIALEIGEDNKATWTLSDIDTAKAGMAYAQLNYIVGETVVKKSDIYTFRVMDSLTGEGEPPEAYESWLEHLTHLAAEAMAEVLDIEGIVTDKTLTVDGGIADAKAAGDALVLKADKSTTYTKTEVDQMIEDVEVETDTTLSVSGKPADAKKTGDELSGLKADLDAQVSDINESLQEYADIFTGNVDDSVSNWLDEHPEATTTVDFRVVRKTFKTVTEMTSDLTLRENDICVTLGYKTLNDGGCATYIISSTHGSNDIYERVGELYALNLDARKNGFVDVRWFGAINTDENIDSSGAFEQAIAYCSKNYGMRVKIVGNYYINSSIEVYGSLHLFGEHVPSRLMLTPDSGQSITKTAISKIRIADNITAFTIHGVSHESTKYADITLNNIEITGGTNSTFVDISECYGAPSRPSWIIECEAYNIKTLLYSAKTSSSQTCIYTLTVSRNYFYLFNGNVFDITISNISDATIGGLNMIDNVIEQGNTGIKLQGLYGNNVIKNNLLEGMRGNIDIKLRKGSSLTLERNYFEANTGTISIIGEDVSCTSRLYLIDFYDRHTVNYTVLCKWVTIFDVPLNTSNPGKIPEHITIEECKIGTDDIVSVLTSQNCAANMVNTSADTETVKGITYTKNGKSYIISGATTENTSKLIVQTNLQLKAGKTYYLSGVPDYTYSTKVYVAIYDSNINLLAKMNGVKINSSYTPTEDMTVSLRIVVAPNTTIDGNYTITPCLSLSPDYGEIHSYTGDNGNLSEDVSDILKSLTRLERLNVFKNNWTTSMSIDLPNYKVVLLLFIGSNACGVYLARNVNGTLKHFAIETLQDVSFSLSDNVLTVSSTSYYAYSAITL